MGGGGGSVSGRCLSATGRYGVTGRGSTRPAAAATAVSAVLVVSGSRSRGASCGAAVWGGCFLVILVENPRKNGLWGVEFEFGVKAPRCSLTRLNKPCVWVWVLWELPSGGSGTTGNASARSPGTRRHQKALEQEMQSLCHQHGWFVGFSLTLRRNSGVFASRFCEMLVFPRLPCVCLRPVGSAAPPHGY